MQFLREELHELPDERKPGNNTKYQVEDAVMAAFSVFFTQSGSFLEHQRLMKSSKGKDNAESLFSIEIIPGDNQIRNLLDPVPAATIFNSFEKIYQWLKSKEVLRKFLYLNGEILIALDGTKYFSSKKIIVLIVIVVIIEIEMELKLIFMAVSHLLWFLLIKNK